MVSKSIRAQVLRYLGRPTTVFVEISLSTQADEVLAQFEAEVAKVPAVLECHLMTGRYDYLLKVVARDTEDFADIHRRYLARLRRGHYTVRDVLNIRG